MFSYCKRSATGDRSCIGLPSLRFLTTARSATAGVALCWDLSVGLVNVDGPCEVGCSHTVDEPPMVHFGAGKIGSYGPGVAFSPAGYPELLGPDLG